MISRYEVEEINHIWSNISEIGRWLKIERLVNDSLISRKIIPNNTLSTIINKVSKGPADLIRLTKLINDKEKETKHDINAFLFAFEELVNDPDSRWIHYGLTSSDVKDTSLSIAVDESFDYLFSLLSDLADILHARLLEERKTKQKFSARTHGQHAEVDYLWRFFAYYEIQISNLYENSVDQNIIPGKIAGAVGDFKYFPSDVERDVLGALKIQRDATTQIVSRVHHAKAMNHIILIASVIEQLALQIRLFQQSGICEVCEGFSRNQTGSSAMPHKKNPILCENICGLSRILRGFASSSYENIALWGYRDMSHSSVERIMFPDAFHLICFMTKRITNVVEELIINRDVMNSNLIGSSQHEMLNLIRQGKSRSEAYRIVQNGKQSAV